MQRYIIRRFITMVPTLIIVTMISFSIILLLPGDPVLAILGPDRAADKEAYNRIRLEMGLDRPAPIRYLEWAGKAVQGDLGASTRNQQPVMEGIKERLPVTILLSLCAMLLALLIAIPAGIISAVRPNSKADIFGTIFALSGVALPHFWLGIMLIFLFGVILRWLPPSGFISPTEDLGASLRLLIMPSFTLATGIAAVVMRQIRSALIEVMQQDFITTARAKGLGETVVVNRHALRNALIPVVTVIGMQTGRLLGGAVVVEQIFAIPGVGRLAIDSINYRDFPMVQAVILVLAVAVLSANLITDILYAYIDPRIRYA